MNRYTFNAEFVVTVDAENEEQARRYLSRALDKLVNEKGEIRVYFDREDLDLDDDFKTN